MAKGETHVDLSEEQWGVLKAALDGEITALCIQNLRLESQKAAMAAVLTEYLRATSGDFCCVCYKPHSNFLSNHEPWCQRAKARAALAALGGE